MKSELAFFKVRSCLSQVKAGNLAGLAHRATIVSLIISDVIDDPLDIIASGPTCPSFFAVSYPDRIAKSLSIIQKYQLEQEIPSQVMDYFTRHRNSELSVTHKPKNLFNFIIFNNKQATSLINCAASSLNYDFTKILTNSLCGEAKIAGYALACLAYSLINYKHHFTMNNIDRVIQNLNLIDSSQLEECMKTTQMLLGKTICFYF